LLKKAAFITNLSAIYNIAYDYRCPENISEYDAAVSFENSYKIKSYIIRARG
jgi:hypothetical protein